jgi:hypothetical protein
MSSKNTVDYDLDLWINSNVYSVARKGRYASACTKYTNRAIVALADLDVPFHIARLEDGKWQVGLGRMIAVSESWNALAYPICKLIYKMISHEDWKRP